MFKHILLPTDGSELSATAIKEGIRFAKSIECEGDGSLRDALAGLRFSSKWRSPPKRLIRPSSEAKKWREQIPGGY